MNKLSKFVACLNIGLVRRKSVVRIGYSRFSCLVIDKLVGAGYVYGYELIRKYNRVFYIDVFIKHSRGRGGWTINLISRSRRLSFVTHRDLLLKWRGCFVLLSTIFGILDRSEALTLGCGGLVLLRIN